MIAYLIPALCFVILNLLILNLGYLFLRHQLITASWAMFAVALASIVLLFNHIHPIISMLAIIATTFNCMKVIAVTESYKSKPLTLTFKHWLIYASGWAGMRAEPFETYGGQSLPGTWKMVRFGVSRILIGLLLLFAGHQLIRLPLTPNMLRPIITPVLLVGLSLVLHFGILSISAGMWRRSGVNTYLLFRQPVKSLSLSEFWSKRWNIAFSEMTSVAIFRPLKSKIGAAGALMLAFLFSGLLHEFALSIPVKSGYGLPTLYFFIQGSVVLAEKWMLSHRIKLLQTKLIARIWVFGWIILPAPLLFHSRFISQVVWPMAALNYHTLASPF